MTTFTDEDAAALVDCAAQLAKTTAADEKGPQPLAICCIIHQPDVMAVPSASRRMDGAKSVSGISAWHKAFTVLAYQADTIKHENRVMGKRWTQEDMILQQNIAPQFCPWDGGILVMDAKSGDVLCALAASGRTSAGDRRLMVLAAHKMGYRTNFNADGNPKK